MSKDKIALQMQSALQHRGPDLQCHRFFENAGLVHARLSIIDLSEAGNQPMCNEDGTVWIVYNGEIYNHRELRQRLVQQGHFFRSQSDSEAIIHLYEEKGSSCVEDLRGMFAFAIYDLRKKSCLLARDRFGIKPLFYARSGNFFAFGSEINALKCLPEVNSEPEEQAIFDYISFLNVPAPLTFYKGIRALMPGQLVEIDQNLDARFHQYHNFDYVPNEAINIAEAVEAVNAFSLKGVNSQLESDVPLGSLLSGGIDSSLISYYAQKSLPHALKTFNVKFPESAYDETWAAQMVAAHIGSDHQTLLMDYNEGGWELVTGLLRHCGQPFADTSLFAVNGVSALMRRHVKVALSGDGGDEAFGGYTLYHEIEKILRFQEIPRFIRKPGEWFLKPFNLNHPQFQKLKRGLDYFNDADETDILQNIFCWIRPKDQQLLWRGGKNMMPTRRYFEPAWQFAASLDTNKLNQLSAATTRINTDIVLPNDFLFKVDIASMKESLEVRVPMLDEALFAFGIKLPHSLKVTDKESKLVLRELARKVLPLKVANKPKQGFGIPVDKWVTAEFKQEISALLLRSNAGIQEFLNPSIYKEWVGYFCNNKLQNSLSREGLYQRVIMLLALELHLSPAK